MREEHVTKALLKWLIDNKWEIICFDFPQSGTGRLLHPNGANEKNKGAINPDIVAVRNGVCLFFENKDRFFLPDYEKVNGLIVDNDYTDDIAFLLSGHNVDEFYYGIGLPTEKHNDKSQEAAVLVDFIIGVNADKTALELYNPKGISF